MPAELPWYQTDNNSDYQKFVKDLRLGDLVEIERKRGYCHWAVCVGVARGGAEPEVVHRTGPAIENSIWHFPSTSSGNSTDTAALIGAGTSKGMITKTTLKKVSFDYQQFIYNRVRINNSKDMVHTPKAVAAIVATALRSIGKGDDDGEIGCYDLLKNNCEHFANYCRYGDKLWSDQVDGMIAKAKKVAVTAAAVGISIVAYYNPFTVAAITGAILYNALNRK